MKKLLIVILLACTATALNAQTKLYDEGRDAMQQIDQAVAEAAQTHRHVLCQVGGNWCPWCLRFAHFADTNATVRNTIDSNFVYIHVNYSKENRNPEAMRSLANPARFGFPVFVILDGEGHVLHIQNSSYLEEGKGYNVKKVDDFLRNWTPTAVNTLK